MLWLSGAAHILVKAAVVFQIGREDILHAARGESKPDLNDAPLAGKIERLMKGPKFSLSHHASPSQAPSPYKKQRLNLNASLAFGGSPNGRRDRVSTGARNGHRDGGRGF